MKKLVSRRNNRFIIDRSFIKDGINKDDICNALYAEIYLEFRGANKHHDYSKLSNLQRFKAINDFAQNWLQTRGLYNEKTEI